MASYSSYRNPISENGDRDKPEVVAPSGVSGSTVTAIYTTNNTNPWIHNAIYGTSYAAPQIAGEAALLMQRRPSITLRPETVKAIIMASANNNIEGDSRLSDKDGAGGVNCLKAFNTADGQRWKFINTTSFPQLFNITATANQKVRAVICWSSPSNILWDELTADLDLEIWDPSNNLLVMSTSYDNSFEIVEFTAPVTGTYKAEVYSSGDNSYEKVGFAYAYY